MHFQAKVLREKGKSTLCCRTPQTDETIKPELIANAVFVTNEKEEHYPFLIRTYHLWNARCLQSSQILRLSLACILRVSFLEAI